MNWKRKSERSWGRLDMRYKTEKLGKFLYIKGRIGWKGLKKSEYLEHSEYKIINGESLTKNGIDWDKAGYISKERYDESPEIMLQNEDILISKDGTIGKLGFVENLSFKATVASGIFVLRNLNSNLINTRFIYNYLSSSYFSKFIISRTEGSVIPHLYQKDFVQLDFPLPSLKIQEKIVEILDVISLKIKLNNEINNNLEQQAHAIFKSWFVDYEPSNGKIPSDWKEYKLRDFLPVITGKKNANVSSNRGLYPFFSCSQDITWTNEYSFEGGAILVAGNGDFNVKFYNGKFEAYQRTYVLIPHNPRFSAWLFYAVKYNLNKIKAAARGSVIKFITKGNLEDFSFYAPLNLDDFDVIDQFTAINNIVASNREENARLADLRDTLLPKLMSGELDVSNIDL